MTDIKQVSDWALTIAAEAAGSKLHHYERMADDNRLAQSIEAHARAIEQHEAFRQEVSDAVAAALDCGDVERLRREGILSRFVIAKPDPLVVVLGSAPYPASSKELAAHIRADMKARGYEWRKIEGEG